jgi:glycosyltransferase involved in cell wall biosynthesis
VRLAFVHYPGRLSRLPAAHAGEAPTEFLFGAIELERRGHVIEHFQVDPSEPAGIATLIDRGSRRGLMPPHLGGAGVVGVRRLLPRLRRADVVVGSTTGTAMALASWRLMGRLDRPLVGIVAGLANRQWRWARRRTTLPLLHRMEVVLYGDGELEPMLVLDRRLRGRLHVNRFGVDTTFWCPGDVESGGYVLGIGNDGNRDWNTLVAAAAEIPAEVRIFTRRRPPSSLPGNVRWQDADWYTQVLSDAEVRDLYRRAAVVVVPVNDVPQPSGQSVTLQAMACGRPVVLTGGRGLWAPETLRHEDNVVLVPPYDPSALAEETRRLLRDRERAATIGAAARESVLLDASTVAYAERLEAICAHALASS